MRGVHNIRRYVAPEVTVTEYPARRAKESKTWKRTSCKSKFASQGRGNGMPWEGSVELTRSTRVEITKR